MDERLQLQVWDRVSEYDKELEKVDDIETVGDNDRVTDVVDETEVVSDGDGPLKDGLTLVVALAVDERDKELEAVMVPDIDMERDLLLVTVGCNVRV